MWILILVVLASKVLGYFLISLILFFTSKVVPPFQPKNLAPLEPKKIRRATAWARYLRKILGHSSDQERFEHYWSKFAPALAQVFNNTPGVITWTYEGQWHLESDEASGHQLLQLYACLQPLPQDLSFATNGVFFLAEKDSILVKFGITPYALLGVHSTYEVSWVLKGS